VRVKLCVGVFVNLLSEFPTIWIPASRSYFSSRSLSKIKHTRTFKISQVYSLYMLRWLLIQLILKLKACFHFYLGRSEGNRRVGVVNFDTTKAGASYQVLKERSVNYVHGSVLLKPMVISKGVRAELLGDHGFSESSNPARSDEKVSQNL